METVFINTKNSKENEFSRFRYYFTDNLNLKNNKTIALANLSVYFTWKNFKSEYKSNKFKITVPTRNEEFMHQMDHSVPDIQDYFEYIIKKHETITDEDSPIKIYANKLKNRIGFKIKTEYKLELLTKETLLLLGSSKKEIDQHKDEELVPKIENVDVALIYSNVVNNTYQQKSRVLYSFVSNKQFGGLINVEAQSLILVKTTSGKLSFIEIWFTNQNNEPLEIEVSVNITLIVGPDKKLKSIKFYKMCERKSKDQIHKLYFNSFCFLFKIIKQN